MVETLIVGRALARAFPGHDGPVRVLSDVDCTIAPGARIGLVGPSGSGKTTLLHILGDLDKPTSGSVSWPGLDGAIRLRPCQIGMVFQSPSLLPALTVAQNVALPVMLAGLDPNPDANLALLASFGLADLADKLPEELSGGQAQRVGMARALAPRPSVVLADEPTGQLDSITAKFFIDALLRQLEGSHTALVIATHDETTAARMTTQWRMDHGRLVSGGMEGEVA